MRYIFFSLLFPFCLVAILGKTQASELKPQFTNKQNLASQPTSESFYTLASRLVQQQINLIARIEQALTAPDANQMRSVRGQLTIHVKSVESFLKRQHKSPLTWCSPSTGFSGNVSLLTKRLTESHVKIYCSLYTSSQELLKIAPFLDQLLSRRGELALVRELPLVTGERQSDPVLAIAPLQRPHLSEPAIPFAYQEPNVPSSPVPIIGRTAKTAIADYVPPLQPAIAPPQSVLSNLTAAKKLLTIAKLAFPPDTQFTDPQENVAILDRFAYNIDPQEPQIYAKFLQLPHTGIFRVLPYSAYLRPLNTLQNRLQASVSQRYPFPSLDITKGSFNPSLALQMVGDRFGLVHFGVDYGFMVDLGNVPLDKLDGKLTDVAPLTRDFFLNYQPPVQLDALQVERRRFLTGKDQNWHLNQIILADAQAELNHTYLVRSLQFQLPEQILSNIPLTQQKGEYLEQLKQIHSSDIILAFQAVRRRADGSYTIIWRVLNQLPDPQIQE